MSRFSLPALRLAGTFAIGAALLSTGAAQAAVTLTGGGLLLAEQGGTFAADDWAAAANGAIPFASSDLGPELGIPFHRAVNLNDGFYGNANSWIGGATSAPYPLPFAGVSLDGAFVLSSIAFGRDNLNAFFDRDLGPYTLQYTTVAGPDATTADALWNTIGTLNYLGDGGPNFSAAHLRHRYNFTAVAGVTGVRLLVPATGIGSGTAIDEIELYTDPGAVVPPPPHLVLSPAAGFTIGFNGNNGVHSTPSDPAVVPDNFALASRGAIPLGSSALGPQLGLPFHVISNVNDGEYGNSHSWIGGDGDANPFIGVAFDGIVAMTSVAWGRDNGNAIERADAFTDRDTGVYTLQYTLVASPDATTGETGDASTGWASIGTVDILDDDDPGVFEAHLRHEFVIGGGGGLDAILATGFRLKVPFAGLNLGTAVDEIEVYGTLVPEPSTAVLAAFGLAGLVIVRRGRRRCGSARRYCGTR